MSRNNTGNPIGSKAFPDFEDNVKNLDEAANSSADTFQDRLGKSRLTWAGMENQFDADQSSREAVFSNFLQASGYQDLGEYAPGIEITAHNQYVTFGGQPYLLKPSIPVPYTTSGEWTGDDFKLIGDDSLRQDLANPDKGAAMVARGVVAVDSIADLLALPPSVRTPDKRFVVDGGGIYQWDGSDFVPSRIAENEYIDESGFSLERSLASDAVTYLSNGPYELEAPIVPLTGKQIKGPSGHYGTPTITCQNGFLDYQGADGVNLENLNIMGAGKGVTQNPILDFTKGGSARQNRISQVMVRGGDVGVAISGGWNYMIDGVELRDCAVGLQTSIHEEFVGWAGSGYVISNAYVGGNDVGIDDSGFWGAAYIAPVIEYNDIPYKQDVNGSTTFMINPWFESNYNPAQWRRDTVVIGGRGMDFSDASFFGSDACITWLRNGVQVFRDQDNPVFRAKGNGITALQTRLNDVGFSPRMLAPFTPDGIEIINGEDSAKGIFSAKQASSAIPEENTTLRLQGYSTFYYALESAMDNNAPAAEIAFAAERSGAGGGQARGLIQFKIASIYHTDGNSNPSKTIAEVTRSGVVAGEDNVFTLGSADRRFSEVFAGTGTINTSDGNEKQDVEALDEAEKRVALKIKGLIRKYRFKDAVALKGDAARIHFGVIAQDVELAFMEEGLDPSRYAMFCRDVWHELDGHKVDVDEEGYYIELIQPGSEAGAGEGDDTQTPEVFEEIKHETVRRERLGIRYDELLAFVISAI